ncbi:hypothetical protein A6A06_13200 [Streptomyces sp. CB02923]|uniref:hypothetical protein n=1 Tax=Streptomyces sp. CB02923 TaxID=1718985 RepID=UPI00093C9374|nr:hypothetical protein [Streptomyces sp. CB02923]OKI02052.1 hypothetical protein A6A06_13200 [Streptomyces sp. CB02923]
MQRKKWIRTAATVALAVTAASACGSSQDPLLTKGTPVPSPTASPSEKVSPQHPAPGKKAPVLEQIKYDLESRVLYMGGAVPKPTSSSCDTAEVGENAQTFTCTVKYMGVDVPFRVETKGGFILMQYTATPTKGGVLTAEGMRARAWKQYGMYGGSAARSLRCDKAPAVQLVPIDRPSGYRCYVGEGGLKGSYDAIVTANGMRLT